MKLIRQITDLNKAIRNENDLGFVPTMGTLHKGHEFLIRTSKKKCKKVLVSIFINPTQFNNKEDYKTYPRNLDTDIKILRKLKVNYVYLPTINQIYNGKRLSKITLKKSQKILCAKYRKGHFEGVLNVLNRFIKLISPKIMFMGEKDYQQYFLTKDYITKRYKTKIHLCKTIRSSNSMALSSRNVLLNSANTITAGLISRKLIKLKRSLHNQNKLCNINSKKFKKLINETKINLIEKFNIEIEYLECRNLETFTSNIHNKPFKLFICYYLNKIRLIDNF